MGIGRGKGYRNILSKDVLIHSRAGRGLTTYVNRRFDKLEKTEIKPLSRDVKKLKKGEVIDPPKNKLSNKPEQRQLQQEILNLIYNVKQYGDESATEREVLTITVLNQPSNKLKGRIPQDQLDFLSTYTTWKVIGETGQWGREQNLVMQVEFLDTKSNSIGQRLIELFDEYNRKYVKEDVLYVKTEKLSESSLPLQKWR